MYSNLVVAVLVAVTLLLLLGSQPAAAIRPESIASALGSNSNSRRLLSCTADDEPRYKPQDGSSPPLPLCATQYFPAGETGKYNRVTKDTPDPMSKAAAADLAFAWSQDSANPKTTSTMQCFGEVDTTTTRECWSGKAVEVDAVFTSLSCCSTAVTCYVKSGGCVMR